VRRWALAAASAGLVLTAGLVGAVSGADAKSFAGVVPDVLVGGHAQRAATAHAADLPYLGGPVVHSNRTHLIFWEPAGSGLTFEPGYIQLVERFLADVAADSHRTTNVYGLSGQYHDGEGIAAYDSTYRGAILASDRLPANGCTEPPPGIGPGWGDCLDDQQIEDEITRVVGIRGLPVTGHEIYFLVLPRGLGVCEFSGPTNCALGGTTGGFCGYHSTTLDLLLYAVIPYDAIPGHCQSGNPRPNDSTADPTISTVSHEHNETVTDPLGNGWIDSSAEEAADLCVTSFGPSLGGAGPRAFNELIHGHRYYLQEEWSNRSHGCRARAKPDSISFKAPRRATAGESVSFSARAGDPQGSIASFSGRSARTAGPAAGGPLTPSRGAGAIR
jgi:hypothetical protein